MIDHKRVGLSAMHHVHVDLGALMVEVSGWMLPARYTSAESELDRIRRAAGIADISPAAKLSLQGRDLGSLLGDRLHPPVGTVGRFEARGADGLSDGLMARLASDEALVLGGAGQAGRIEQVLRSDPGRCAHVVAVTSAMAGVRLAGPAALDVVRSVTDLDLRPSVFPNMTCAQTKVAEVYGMVLRVDAGDLPAYELFFGREFGEYMWHALTEAGEPVGLTPFGTEAGALLERGS